MSFELYPKRCGFWVGTSLHQRATDETGWCISRGFLPLQFSPINVVLVFGDLPSLLRGFPLSLVPFQLIKPPNVQETHLRSKKILVSKQHCCRMHNYMRATDSCHIALVYTYKQPRLNTPITKFSFMRSLGMYFIVHSNNFYVG